ncbi:MAG: twin-arginine translocation signal domain-containing protein [Cyanobacteria bacterium P01_A01_bin.137]
MKELKQTASTQIPEAKMNKAKVSRRSMLKGATTASAVAATAIWTKPVVNAVILPVHAQTSSPVFSAGTYDFAFPGGGTSNTENCEAGSVNAGRTLTAGVADFSADVSADGTFTASVLTDLIGTTIVPNVVAADGSINFNDTFAFTEPLLGACETEITISGNASGSTISGNLSAEVRCEGCTSSFTTSFTGALAP